MAGYTSQQHGLADPVQIRIKLQEHFAQNQNIGCFSWPAENSTGMRALKNRDIWFEGAWGVFQALTLLSVVCIAYEFGKFGTTVPWVTISPF